MRSLSFPLLAAAMAVLGGCGSDGSNGSLTGDDYDAGPVMVVDDASFPDTGNQYVNSYRCPACHQGPDPQQTGFMSGATSPIPGDFGQGVVLYGPNLTPDPTTGIGSWDDDQISNAILNGIDDEGERLCPQMQHFPNMPQDQVTSIIGYLHSLKPVVNQAPASHCPPLKP